MKTTEKLSEITIAISAEDYRFMREVLDALYLTPQARTLSLAGSLIRLEANDPRLDRILDALDDGAFDR